MEAKVNNKGSEIAKPANLECIDLQEYLKSKPQNVIESLYNYPSICLAVYRELPEIARQFVIRILFVEQPVPQAVVASWTVGSLLKTGNFFVALAPISPLN